MIGSPVDWEENGQYFARARFAGSKDGIKAAEQVEANLRPLGFVPIDVSTTGGGTDLSRSVGKSLLGLGMLGLTGVGFVGTSRKRAEFIVTYQKVRQSDQEIEDARRAQVTLTSGAEAAMASSSLLSHVAATGSPFRARVERGASRGRGWLGKYSADLTVLVGNGSREDLDGFELAILFHDERGATIASEVRTYLGRLPAGESLRVAVTVDGVRKGDWGVLAAVVRTLHGSDWRSV